MKTAAYSNCEETSGNGNGEFSSWTSLSVYGSSSICVDMEEDVWGSNDYGGICVEAGCGLNVNGPGDYSYPLVIKLKDGSEVTCQESGHKTKH